jgi:hypothetical protein
MGPRHIIPQKEHEWLQILLSKSGPGTDPSLISKDKCMCDREKRRTK